MNSQRMSASGGFTLLELLVVVAIGSLVLGGALEAFSGGHGLVTDSRARTQAKAEHRRNLIMIANAIRAADIREMGGFGEDGIATQPVIRRVKGADLVGRTHEEPETIRWVAKSGTVQGVDHPGALFAVSDSGDRMLADRVTKDSFSCEQRGTVIIINLETYYQTSDGKTIVTDGPTAVQIRNFE